MADLTDLEAAGSTKIVGSTSTGLETTAVGATPNGDLKNADLLAGGGVQSSLTVGLTAVEVKVGASKLANRKIITIMPINRDMWWGYTSGVTIATGTPVFKNQTLTISASDTCTVYLITDQAAKEARITESP